MAAWACSSPKRRVGGADGDGGDDDVHHGVEDEEQVRSSNVYEVSYTILVADMDAMIHE